MSGRLGNGMALWLGGALLAHAALLALPTARSPAGGSVVSNSLDVRLFKATTGSDPVATKKGSDTFSTAGSDSIPVTKKVSDPFLDPVVEKVFDPIFSMPLASPRARKAANPITARVTATPGPPPRATVRETVSRQTGAGPAPASQVGADPILALSEASEEEVADIFSDAFTASAGQANAATVLLDDPARHPAGTPDQHERLRLLELTDRLHRAIERQKRYPLSARRLGREGTASVAFRLRPDGAIDDLVVAATSGEPALDRAALRAVSGISPFAEARAYLDSSAPFRVDIAFRLH
jgi:protein TonB